MACAKSRKRSDARATPPGSHQRVFPQTTPHQQLLAAKGTSDGLEPVVDGGHRRRMTLIAIRQYDHRAPPAA